MFVSLQIKGSHEILKTKWFQSKCMPYNTWRVPLIGSGALKGAGLLWTAAHPSLQQLEHGFLSLPSFSDKRSGNTVQYWLLLDRIIQQIVIQNDKGQDPDSTPLENFNIKNVVRM